VKTALARRRTIAPATGFLLRTLLVHDYRRLLLRDPTLPATLLPRAWPGHGARDLATAVYRRVTGPADAFADAELAVSDGPLPPPADWAASRFGGGEN
jgi:phenylacetic acid degradation operon negative regulatory protein